jgi:hypothetical protein
MKQFAEKILKNTPDWVKKILPPLILVLVLLPLRLINLGYSEYICDESVALEYLKDNREFYSWDFLLSQHKGPMQYLFGGVIYLITRTVFNEAIYRIPFALINVLSIVVLYLFLCNLVRNKYAAFFASLVFGLNGLILVFGRIFQYQSLNLLFSFLSLYFFSRIQREDIKDNHKDILRSSVLGSIFFCFSLLSHWDVVFIVPYVLVVILKYVLLRKDLENKFKIKFIIFNATVILALFVFYLYPYIDHYLNSPENQQYFENRVDPEKVDFEKVVGRAEFILFRIRLYNPLLFVSYISGVLLISLIFIRKTWIYLFWFLIEAAVFLYVFTNPGTHIYNMFVPVTILTAISINGIWEFFVKRKNIFKLLLPTLLILFYFVLSVFFFYQSYVLFVDHNPEYPWHTKRILGKKIGDFDKKEEKYLRNNKIGFPLRREWKKIEQVMAKYEREMGLPVGIFDIETNENYCPAVFYTGRTLSTSKEGFVVGVKYPLSLVNDYKRFSSANEKELLEKVKNDDGDTTSYVYIKK